MKPLLTSLSLPFLTFLSPLFFCQQIQAADPECSDILTRQGEFQIHRFASQDGICFFAVDPFNPPDNMKYRSYLFTNAGLLMVFNSYSPNFTARDHGARVFYFFPRGQVPSFHVENEKMIVATATAGVDLLFHHDKMKIAGMNGGVVKESSTVSPSNSGGVEFPRVETLLLDGGFAMGEDPFGDSNRTSVFRDFKGKTCKVKNQQIFKYDSDGDPTFRFSDEKLRVFLNQKCPQLFF